LFIPFREGSGLSFMLKSVLADDTASSAGMSAAGSAWGDGDTVVAGQDRVRAPSVYGCGFGIPLGWAVGLLGCWAALWAVVVGHLIWVDVGLMFSPCDQVADIKLMFALFTGGGSITAIAEGLKLMADTFQKFIEDWG